MLHKPGAYNFAVMVHDPIIHRPISIQGVRPMAASTEDDSQTYFILGLAVGIIALVILLVVGVAIRHPGGGDAASAQGPFPTTVSVTSAAPVPGAPAAAAVTESVVVVVPEGASIRVEGGVVKFYFATGSADLAPGAAEALAAVIQGVGAGKKAQISGFHDATGDAAVNAELAQRRAETVREVLLGLGVPADQVRLKKPEATTGSGSNVQARRVEVALVD
jgi:outer membrane protein OmpA-like peptidoglycan-associated protein